MLSMPTRHDQSAVEPVKRDDWVTSVGALGWIEYGGLFYPDTNNDWTPYTARGLSSSHGTIQKMHRTDPVLRGAVLSMTEVLKAATLHVDPPTQPSALEAQAAEFAAYCLEQTEGGVAGLMEAAALHLVYGFWLQEIILETSRTPWGPRLTLARLEDRHPWTIYRWVLDEQQRLQGAIQTSPSRAYHATLPINKCLLYTHQYSEAGPEGISILRPCYFAWRAKQEVLQHDLGVWEKWGYGVPIAKQTDVRAAGGIDAQIGQVLADYASHLNGFLVGAYGYDIDIKFPAGDAPDPTKRVEMLNREMLVAFLAMFLLHGDQGTRNVTSEQLSFFRASMQHKADYIARVLDTRGRPGSGLIPTLIDLNFALPRGFRYPRARFSGIRERDVGVFVSNLRNLVEPGVITRDPALESYVRRELALPDSEV